jgi:hypothetical protein
MSQDLEILALVIVQLCLHPEAAEEVGHQSIHYSPCPMVRDGVYLWPLGVIVLGN